MHGFETVLTLLVGVTVLAMVARRLDVPTPVLLVVGGLVVALLPGLPAVQFDPRLVFLVFIPPLLFRTSLLASYRDVRANLRPILSLGVGHVLFATGAVAWVAHRVLPGLPWASALALGAVVSPPDVAAATAFLRRLPVPRRIVTILEGESMINDAAAIVAYRLAVAAAVTGAFSFTGAIGRFLLVSTGVLAVVATGMYLGRMGPRFVAADTRVQNVGMWDVVVFVLEGLIFILTGLGLRPILGSLSGAMARELAVGVVLVSLAVIVARFVWVYPAAYFRWLVIPHLRAREPLLPWQAPALVGWAGLRGADSLVLAAAIPTLTAAGTPFPGRDAIIAVTYGVIVVTLVGQGFTLAPLLRWLGLRETGADEEREEVAARLQASEAALARLEELTTAPWMHPDALSHARERYRHRTRHLQSHANGVVDGPVEAKAAALERLTRELLGAERRKLLQLRDQGAISDAVMRRIQRDLDYEELLLHPE